MSLQQGLHMPTTRARVRMRGGEIRVHMALHISIMCIRSIIEICTHGTTCIQRHRPDETSPFGAFVRISVWRVDGQWARGRVTAGRDSVVAWAH